MYLWVIIATFITALFALNISIRPDIRELYVEPQAQTVVTKLYVQHRAAMNYISNRNRNATAGTISYMQGELTAEDLENDLPYGFQQDSGVSKFTTWVYCLDKDNLESTGVAALPSSCTASLPSEESGSAESGSAESDGDDETENTDLGDGSSCCSGSSTVVYLVTYGCVPLKWRDTRSGKPSATLLNAMKTTTGYIHGMGYAIDRDELADELYQGSSSYGESMYTEDIETPMGVYGQGGLFYTPIPAYISDTNAGTDSFAVKCGSLREDSGDYDPYEMGNLDNWYSSCDYCLVYMSKF